MENEICKHAVNILSPLLMAALTWASARFGQLITSRLRSERVRAVLLRLDDAIAAIVREVQQVTINVLKAQGGGVPRDMHARLRVATLASVKAYLGPKGIEDAHRALGLDRAAFDAFVTTRIEAAVLDLKNARQRNGVPALPAADSAG